MAHIKVKQPEFWRAPNWIKMQYPPQPNALQNYLTYLFHSIPSSIFGMQKRHTQGPTQSCRQRHCPSTTLGPASVGPRNRIDKKKRLQVIGWNKPVGLTPEKHETKDIIGLRESHHWDQVATSPDSPHQSYSTNQISKIMDSSWKSGRKKHIGSVLATFPPQIGPNLQGFPTSSQISSANSWSSELKVLATWLVPSAPWASNADNLEKHPVKRYITLPYFFQATPNRRKLLPSVLVKGNLWASTPWVSTPTENFGSMLSCSCCSWPPWDRDRAPAQLMVPANSRSIRSCCGSIIVSVLGSKPKQSNLLSQK